MKTIYFGTAANPFHLGHREIINSLTALDFVNEYDRIVIDVCQNHPWGKEMAPWEARVRMTKRSLSGVMVRHFVDVLDDVNPATTTYDRLLQLRNYQKIMDDVSIVLGFDNAAQIEKFTAAPCLIDNNEFIIIARQNVDKNELEKVLVKFKRVKYIELDMPISSTLVREWCRIGDHESLCGSVSINIEDECLELYKGAAMK